MKKTLLIILALCLNLYAQEADITSALKEIEAGNISVANEMLINMKSKNPNDPSVLFLDAVLTKDANEALSKYTEVYEKYPNNKYADAALYRIFSYNFSLGLYKKAEQVLTKLKAEYPSSPYIKAADRTIPDEVSEEKTLPVIEKETNKESYKFTIQAGAFLNADNAKKLRDNLANDGFSVELITKEIGGSIFNIVLVGKYQTEAETEKVKELLNSKYSLNVRIVPFGKN